MVGKWCLLKGPSVGNRKRNLSLKRENVTENESKPLFVDAARERVKGGLH